MKKSMVLFVALCMLLNATAFAGLDGKKAAYQGGTTKDKDFAGAKEAVVGNLNTSDENNLKFEYEMNKSNKIMRFPTSRSSILSTGRKPGGESAPQSPRPSFSAP